MSAPYSETAYNLGAWDKLLEELYGGREGCIFTLDRHEGRQRRYHVRKFRYMCEKRYITRHTDTYTPNIYWGLGCKSEEILPQNKYRRLAGNIEIVNTLALDIDHYKHYGWLKPMDFFYGHIEPLIGSVMPPPSYIEYGYGLRLIWVLSEPLKLKKGTTEKRSSRPITKAYEATVKRLSEAVNKEVGVTVCEPQKLNSFYRIPGSRNEKTGDVVELEEYTEERYTLQEIMNEYLPELPKWYVEKDAVVVKKNKKITRIHNTYQLWTDRLLKLEEIAETETAINRQNLCFVYLNGLIQTGYEYNLMDAVLAFNKKLINPLPENELKSKLSWQIRYDKAYGLPNDRINELIGIEVFTKAKWTKRERERARKEAQGTTRKQIAERNQTKVLELKEQGLTTREIAEQVGLKPQTVKNIVGKARKEMTQGKTASVISIQDNASNEGALMIARRPLVASAPHPRLASVTSAKNLPAATDNSEPYSYPTLSDISKYPLETNSHKEKSNEEILENLLEQIEKLPRLGLKAHYVPLRDALVQIDQNLADRLRDDIWHIRGKWGGAGLTISGAEIANRVRELCKEKDDDLDR